MSVAAAGWHSHWNSASGEVFVFVVMVTYNSRRTISIRPMASFPSYYSTFEVAERRCFAARFCGHVCGQ
jgi:hypothetical protein